MMQFLQYLLNNGPAMVVAVSAVMVALIGLFQLIPGEQPEKFLQSVVDFIAKFSRKPEVK